MRWKSRPYFRRFRTNQSVRPTRRSPRSDQPAALPLWPCIYQPLEPHRGMQARG